MKLCVVCLTEHKEGHGLQLLVKRGVVAVCVDCSEIIAQGWGQSVIAALVKKQQDEQAKLRRDYAKHARS